jgi:hypothetical protein
VPRRAAAALDEIATAPGRCCGWSICRSARAGQVDGARLLVGLVEVGFARSTTTAGSARRAAAGLGSADAAHIATTFRPALERSPS